jgi:hypothetical protein
MSETATQTIQESSALRLPGRGATFTMTLPINTSAGRARDELALNTTSPVNQNGSFEFDRVIKSGYVQKRTTKTKVWKSVYLVLRPNALSIYKSDKENKLRHKIHLSDLSAVTPLKDPKQKRHNLFGLFSPSKNYHFEAKVASDANEWIDLIRQHARIEEEEEGLFLASPIIRRQSLHPTGMVSTSPPERERFLASSPEPLEPAAIRPAYPSKPSHNFESSGLSGNELASHSDFSDTEIQRVQGASIESLAVQASSASGTALEPGSKRRPFSGNRNASQLSGLNLEQDPDRVVWQGWLWFLKSKRGVKQWKDCWAVLRPRNLILYKDESEYTASFILSLSSIVNVVEIDPVSRTKIHCLQIITDEKSYRLCAHDEELLVQCLGAFKSLLSKRRELEARVATSGNVAK